MLKNALLLAVVALVLYCMATTLSPHSKEAQAIEALEYSGRFGIVNDTIYFLKDGSMTNTDLLNLSTLSSKYTILVSTN